MEIALQKGRILLPRKDIPMETWAVVACDQFTAQPEYWDTAEALVGDRPSTLRLTLPEIYLGESETRVPAIQNAMKAALEGGVLEAAVEAGFVLVRRETTTGVRPGLVVCLDLEQYDFSRDSASLIRPTEGTIASRVPPRAKIRAGARMELPHVMMLIDDPQCTVIEPLLARSASLRKLYDFDLMLGGGHLTGWAVEDANAQGVFQALEALCAASDGLLYAVGDGNHSLAAAKQCWMDMRDALDETQRKNHPARYAMVELVNLNCPALVFEPIHRVLMNVDAPALLDEYETYLEGHGACVRHGGSDLQAVWAGGTRSYASVEHPLRLLQAFLDEYLTRHPEAEIDYIHGDAALRKLAGRPDTLGLMPRAFDKGELFPFIRKWGPLPRKTFSMGEATDKRYYVEARQIVR